MCAACRPATEALRGQEPLVLSVGRGALFQEPGRMRTCGGALLCTALLASLCVAQSRQLKQSLNDVRARHYLVRWAHGGVACTFRAAASCWHRRCACCRV